MNTKTLALVITVSAVLVGLAGVVLMLVCGVFLLSSDPRDIMGAGLGFVGGTVLLGSGIIALAIAGTRRFAE